MNSADVIRQGGDILLEQKLRRGWMISFVLATVLLTVLLASIAVLFLMGVGVWGINIPVAWGFAITNFVWWIGIGHAGTFISAILFLLRQDWRTSISRFAESMTLFAVACAGLFPILHLGRPQFFYYLLPYPDTMGLWPQFRSPLIWDIFAVLTYLTVSFIFWYVGLLPDFAILRDRTKNKILKIIFGVLSFGWRGSALHWKRYRWCYLILAGLATPLVISVHSIVGLDFAVAIVPGWHSTIVPPYFVAGAIFSGFAMILTLGILLRHFFKLGNLITVDHLDKAAKMLLAMGIIVAYSYMIEAFMAFYSDDPFEAYMYINRMTGPYAFTYAIMMFCNVIAPQFLWVPKLRRSVGFLFVLSLIVQLGMWVERFVIVVTSLNRDFLPSSWHLFVPTIWDWATLFGSIGLFSFLFLLFVKSIPVIALSEMGHLFHKKSESNEGAPA